MHSTYDSTSIIYMIISIVISSTIISGDITRFTYELCFISPKQQTHKVIIFVFINHTVHMVFLCFIPI